jgi:hypothetical protein
MITADAELLNLDALFVFAILRVNLASEARRPTP